MTIKNVTRLDLNGRQVHRFSLDIANLGFARMSDLVKSLLESKVWMDFKDNLGVYHFLPGEFDYFLSQCGVKREDVIHGIRDIKFKARLEKAMDERKTGNSGYRRKIEQVRAENPAVPGRPIMPFGFTKNEAKLLKIKGRRGETLKEQKALGSRVRHFRLHGEKRKSLPLLDRLINSLAKLSDGDLDKFVASAKREQLRRQKKIRLVRVAS